MSEVQDVTKEEENPLADLVKSSLDKDYNKANEIFNDVMTVKLTDVLDQAKVKLAGQIYNGDPEDEEIEDEIDGDDTESAEDIGDAEDEAIEDETEDNDADTDEESNEEELDDGEEEIVDEDDGDDEIEGAAVLIKKSINKGNNENFFRIERVNW